MNDLNLLLISAMTLGCIHTLMGPDHYIPFIALSKARNWSLSHTLWITLIAGIGHIAGSVLLGFAGVALGISLSSLEYIESVRGDIVAWMLIAFGVGYATYGFFRHLHHQGHSHLPKFLIPKRYHHYLHHPASIVQTQSNTTPWVLFIIFVFGPCEVLIPLLIFPAAQHNMMGVAQVASLFGITTIVTMLMAVWVGYQGLSFVRMGRFSEYLHMAAGLVIFMTGIGVKFLGW
jgi:sulfite exporter TauE/SafE